ncbi:HAD-IIIA family hydrolase [bacterium]|nr:HAD-IIIA family hydrolase [bacterium]
MSVSALILDRDGTLIAFGLNPEGDQDSAYFQSQLELYPQATELLRPFCEAGVPIFLATNQPGISKGHFTVDDLEEMHAELERRLKAGGVSLAGIYSCVHHPVGKAGGDPQYVTDCDCRKPKPGLLTAIAQDHGLDLTQAIMIGDSSADEGAARAAGIGAFFLVRAFISEVVPPARRVVPFPEALTFEQAIRKAAARLSS